LLTRSLRRLKKTSPVVLLLTMICLPCVQPTAVMTTLKITSGHNAHAYRDRNYIHHIKQTHF